MSLVNLNIDINGLDKSLPISSFTLRQAWNNHHRFEISILLPEAPLGKNKLTGEQIISLIGQTAKITIQRNDRKGGICIFEGFVDQVTPVWHSHVSHLQIIGYSKSVLLDTLPGFRSFTDQSPASIAQYICRQFKLPLQLQQPHGATPYSVQAQETAYRYLCRLADQTGNWFFYDGIQQYWGTLPQPSKGKLVLRFGQDLQQVALSYNAAPAQVKIAGWQIEQAQMNQQTTVYSSQYTDQQSIGVARQSMTLFQGLSTFEPGLATSQQALQQSAAGILSQFAQEWIQLKGTTSTPELKIGSIFSIDGTDEAFSRSEYVIISIEHQVNNDRSYQNSFTAIPTGSSTPTPLQNYSRPVCGPLMAIVKDHQDPQKLGRVRIQFIGDEVQSISPWLRVLTAYTGHGGMYFMPEKGDHVQVFSEAMHPEKEPFVMPAFFHGKATAADWYDPENRKKGFTTEKIAFKIDDRTGKLLIEADEIEIVSRKKMTLNGGNQIKQTADQMEITANQQMKVEGGSHLTLSASRIDLNP